MEVTLTPAVTSSYQDACRLLEAVVAVANSPSILENSLFAVQEDEMPDGESLYWIQNLTDCPVHFWLQKPEQVQPNRLFQPPDLGEDTFMKTLANTLSRADTFHETSLLWYTFTQPEKSSCKIRCSQFACIVLAYHLWCVLDVICSVELVPLAWSMASS